MRVPEVNEIVFLPGAGGRSSFWKAVADRLGPFGRCQLLGWPGFGDEPADETLHGLGDVVGWLLSRLPPGPSHLVAQSMGGVVAVLVALRAKERVASLVLAATSGGLDVAEMGGAEWREQYRREFKDVPDWFVLDRTDLSARLCEVSVPTLVLYGDADPISPPRVASALCERIRGARAICVEGGSHAFAAERPDEVAKAVAEHLARCGGPGRGD